MGNAARRIAGLGDPLQAQRDALRRCQRKVEEMMEREGAAAESSSSLGALQRRKYQEHLIRQAQALVARLDEKAQGMGRKLQERGGGGSTGAAGGDAVAELGRELQRAEQALAGPADEDGGARSEPMSLRRKAAVAAWASWMLLSFCMPREFGVPWFIVGALIGICTLGLETRTRGDTLSAYSVFNPGVERLEGAMTADSFALPGQPRYDAPEGGAGPSSSSRAGAAPAGAPAHHRIESNFVSPSGITLADYEDAYEEEADADGAGGGPGGQLRLRGKERNAACPCGSGKKAKKCCG
eukprot:tig00020938_g16148.t1